MKKNITQINSVEDFHSHLDECEQCREHPFNLCPEGELILKKVTTGEVNLDDIRRYVQRVTQVNYSYEELDEMFSISKEMLEELPAIGELIKTLYQITED